MAFFFHSSTTNQKMLIFARFDFNKLLIVTWLKHILVSCFYTISNQERTFFYWTSLLPSTLEIARPGVILNSKEAFWPCFNKPQRENKDFSVSSNLLGWRTFVLGKFRNTILSHDKINKLMGRLSVNQILTSNLFVCDKWLFFLQL